jgi:predicted enzyme related to lactoylglutathione lyase
MRNAAFWSEIPVTDFDRATRFYENVFNVKLIPRSIKRASRYGIFPLDPQSPGAGLAIVEGDGNVPSDSGTVIYIDRDEDLLLPLSRIEESGGTVLLGKTENSGGNGYIALFRDSEGNKVGLHSSV